MLDRNQIRRHFTETVDELSSVCKCSLFDTFGATTGFHESSHQIEREENDKHLAFVAKYEPKAA